MSSSNTLGEFLRARRAQLVPDPASPSDRRRVPGLRREEIARSASISVDYYARIEQGRAGVVSDEVLQALVDALALSVEQRTHLFALARPRHVVPVTPGEGIAITGLRTLAELTAAPAMVVDRRYTIVVANTLLQILISPPDVVPSATSVPGSMAEFVFLDRRSSEVFADWPVAARGVLTRLRFQAARHPRDDALTELITDLHGRSRWFADHWSDPHMDGLWAESGSIVHPRWGTYRYNLLTLTSPAHEEYMVHAYVPSDAPAVEVAHHLRHAHLRRSSSSASHNRST
ncbi:helix-turn-helix transcriptional regulator [Cellulomonas shaoxiangyii]|uniref:XRE family transcriptional regulator n=1 Tax=Cellulomonas shaoxiangyii TaxID=2566013 RepID=A0A4P7SLK7_9CELL|nr:helix-turn-helix transcriptional regulator [Cellulomonas shaoxiangyii]QCB93694.1 XRE family transcriptional regulator [Cellulomonas shaoxiangyii]TGY86175.1 XRE family transcriptional regulator [Cellulomonas shaoxiangyii]